MPYRNLGEHLSLLKKWLSARSALQKSPKTSPKHYANAVFGPRTGGTREHEGSVGSRRSACGRGCVGTFLSPRAPIQLPWGVVLVLQALVLASAAAGLVATGHRSLALVFGVIIVINAILIYVWGQ